MVGVSEEIGTFSLTRNFLFWMASLSISTAVVDTNDVLKADNGCYIVIIQHYTGVILLLYSTPKTFHFTGNTV